MSMKNVIVLSFSNRLRRKIIFLAFILTHADSCALTEWIFMMWDSGSLQGGSRLIAVLK